jgi:hypothetical protein
MAVAPTLSAVETGDQTELWIDVGAGLVEVAEVTDLPDLPSFTQTTYETTHMKSGPIKEFKKNVRQEGDEMDITFNYVPGSAGETTLKAAIAMKGAANYQIRTPQGDQIMTVDGYALFTSLKRTNPMEDRRQMTVTMKPVSFTAETLAAAV